MSVPQIRVLPRERAAEHEAAQRRGLSQFLTIVLFLVPGAIVYTLFLIWPIIQAMYYSLFNWKGLGPPTDFIGFENFATVLNDPIFHISIGHTLALASLSLTIQLPMALGLAILIGRKLPGRAFFRVIFFLPYVFSEVVTALIWLFVYIRDGGLANTIFKTLIPGFEPQAWLANRDIALVAIFVVITWKYFGLHMILYMAALQNVPAEIEEAARIDGANEWSVLRYITIPSIGATIRLTIYLSAVGSLNQFVIIWLLTTGGPSNATHVITTYMYRFGPLAFKYGYAAAVSIVLFTAAFIFSILYQRFVMRQDYAD